MAKLKKVKAKTPAPSAKRGRNAGVMDYVVKLFQANERAPKSQKMTDHAIRDALIRRFGDHGYMHDVASLRSGYNRGRYTLGVLPPQSYKYDERGNRMAKSQRYQKPVTPTDARATKAITAPAPVQG